jgi:hypothetical protein
MNRRFALSIALALAALLRPSATAAQQPNIMPTPSANVQASSGWSVTPSLAYSGSWDDNVLVAGKGDATVADFLNVVNPRVSLDFNGRRGQISANYDGAFVMYRDLGSLNSYDQRAWVYGRRLLSPHVALFVRNQVASVPTTELSEFLAVPFVRTGSKLDDLRGGVEASFTKRTSMTASYHAEWVEFDPTQPGSTALRGGHSNGGNMVLKHKRSEQLAFTAEYDLQHAIVGILGEAFNIQNGWGGIEYKLSDVTRIFGAFGISRLGVTNFAQPRTGPAWRAGLSRRIRTAGVELLWSRSFVPSYGFGGTTQNEEISGRLNLPIGRRFYSNSALAWRSNDPLTVGLPLRSSWIEGSLGYMATPRLGLEVFYTGTHQTIDRPGGQVDRRRIGFQVITGKPVRIR